MFGKAILASLFIAYGLVLIIFNRQIARWSLNWLIAFNAGIIKDFLKSRGIGRKEEAVEILNQDDNDLMFRLKMQNYIGAAGCFIAVVVIFLGPYFWGK